MYLYFLIRYAESERRATLRNFKLSNAFNATDGLLQQLELWPNVSDAEYYQTKNKFQLQHVLFRSLSTSHSTVIASPLDSDLRELFPDFLANFAAFSVSRFCWVVVFFFVYFNSFSNIQFPVVIVEDFTQIKNKSSGNFFEEEALDRKDGTLADSQN